MSQAETTIYTSWAIAGPLPNDLRSFRMADLNEVVETRNKCILLFKLTEYRPLPGLVANSIKHAVVHVSDLGHG